MPKAKAAYYLNRFKSYAPSAMLIFGGLFCSAVSSASESSGKTLQSYSLPNVQIMAHQIVAPAFKQIVQVRVFLPPNYSKQSKKQYPSLYINDGQDAEAMALAVTLRQLVAEQKISPVIVVAVSMLPDRMATYGFSDRNTKQSLPAQTRFGPVGLRAYEYSDWLAVSLVPYIDAHYRTRAKPEARAILGWSLGAANAFNIGWNYPDVFSKVGAFSPSFWLSAKSGEQVNAIALTMIERNPVPDNFSLWLAVGDAEETNDRDGDGMIDVIDDAHSVIEALTAKTVQSDRNNVKLDLQLRPFSGGQHNQQTWKQMLPQFLIWAYPVDNTIRK